MAGIYLHIPFCRKACHYCNFHFSTQQDAQEQMVEALIKEAELRKLELQENIETVYFGGGTPSILPASSIARLIDTLRTHYHINEDAEYTLEANPDDISPEKAKAWKEMGINRFSIGIQTFNDAHLQQMNRAHHADQSSACIRIIRDAGFSNFSIDLIYGMPTQSIQEWEMDIDKAIALNIPHLSCYALTVEEGTALHHMSQQGKIAPVDPDHQARCFELLMEKTGVAGYHHYEISNLALPGHESRHNSAYWEGKPYMGLGPSAHSFNGRQRSWNISHNIDYLKAIAAGELPSTAETLSEMDLLNEYIMTALRSSKGLNKQRILEGWGQDRLTAIQQGMQAALMAGNAVEDDDAWRLTRKGKFLADGIAASLFFLHD